MLMEARSIDGGLAAVDAPEQELQNVDIDIFMCMALFDLRRYVRPARFLGYFSAIQAYSLSSLQPLPFTNSLALILVILNFQYIQCFFVWSYPECIPLSKLANSSWRVQGFVHP